SSEDWSLGCLPCETNPVGPINLFCSPRLLRRTVIRRKYDEQSDQGVFAWLAVDGRADAGAVGGTGAAYQVGVTGSAEVERENHPPARCQRWDSRPNSRWAALSLENQRHRSIHRRRRAGVRRGLEVC